MILEMLLKYFFRLPGPFRSGTNDMKCAIALILLGALLLTSCIARTASLHRAIKTGDSERVRAMLDRDSSLIRSRDYDGWTPLHTASFFGQKDIVTLLIERGAEVNAKDTSGESPLHLLSGADGGDAPEETAAILISKGAEIDSKNLFGWTPLHNAVMEDQKELASLLISRGAHVNERNNDNETPMRIAEKLGKKDMVELLRQSGGHE